MQKQKILIGSDHAGFLLKNQLINYLDNKYDLTHEIENIGTYGGMKCDYPDIAHKLSEKVIKNNCLGILICGTGIGISIAANKNKGIRCALCNNQYMAKMSRKHNNSNVIALGARVIGSEIAKQIIDTFISTEFENESRHLNRINKIELSATKNS